MQIRKTKIVCSLGPTSRDDDVIRELILSGMNVARLNFSHGTHEEHRVYFEKVKKISAELGVSVAVLLDTKGPEIRTGMVENDGKVTISKDDKVEVSSGDGFTTAAQDGIPARISVTWEEAASRLKSGHHILVADGLLDLEVINVSGGFINCRAANTAVIGSKKNVNLTGVHAMLPIMSDQDKMDIAFGVKLGVDFIAASFLSFPYEVIEIKKYLESLGSAIKVIAKIESAEGLDNIQEIAHLADGVMVARGDLGVQLPTEQIPLAQKHIINICRRAGKPVITATQMLESMISNPRPTRAELTDVANAIFDGTDAIMLSGETANGAYPIEAVKTMDKIAYTVEQSPEFRSRMKESYNECLLDDHNPKENLGIIMSRSGVEIASSVEAKAIVTPTLSGRTARLISVYRPYEPVLAVTPSESAQRTMQLYWGVYAHYAPLTDESGSMISTTMNIALSTGFADISDKIVLVAGLPIHSPLSVNTVRILILGTILARSGFGGKANGDIERIQGKILHVDNPDDAMKKIKMHGGEIIVCKTLTADFAPALSLVKAVICEGVPELSNNELCEINPNLVWLTRIKNAAEKLESGLTVTIDTKQLLVYEGAI